MFCTSKVVISPIKPSCFFDVLIAVAVAVADLKVPIYWECKSVRVQDTRL